MIVALEGTRSYGVGLARALTAAGVPVIESEQPRHNDRRNGKSDPIDARLAALNALRLDSDRLPTPRADGDREALRILLSARGEHVTTRTRQINRLRALLLTGDDTDRQISRHSLTNAKLTQLARRRARAHETREQQIRRLEIRRLARAITDATTALADNKTQLEAIVAELAPALNTTLGVGPICAAQAIISWSHHGRCRSETAFTALAGVNPIPATSGQTIRHRLNPGGDRALNQALHTITLTRWRCCPRTKDYITKRRAQGKTDNEIRRYLKRYIAREIYRTLNTH